MQNLKSSNAKRRKLLYYLYHTPFVYFFPSIISRFRLKNILNNTELNIDFEFLSELIIECNLTGCYFHPGLPLTTCYEKIFNEKKENMKFIFGAGAQFIVSKKKNLTKAKNYLFKNY